MTHDKTRAAWDNADDRRELRREQDMDDARRWVAKKIREEFDTPAEYRIFQQVRNSNLIQFAELFGLPELADEMRADIDIPAEPRPAVQSDCSQVVGALSKLVKISKAEVPAQHRGEYAEVWQQAEDAIKTAQLINAKN